MNVLVIAAHPDDEVLGCGGAIARLASEGASVSILILAEGLTARPDFDQGRRSEELEIHHARARRAASLLGAKEVRLCGFPDNRMDTVPMLEVVQVIEREIARVRPETVFTQHGGDLNVDHVVTFRATLTATRPLGGGTVKRVYAYEVGSSTEWSFQQFSPAFQPNTFFGIGGHVETKVAAMQLYESETRIFPHPRSPEAIRAAAARWGSVSGTPAAEAFQLVREVR